MFEISTIKSVYLLNFTKKQKYLNLGPKVLDLGIFGLEFEKNIVILSALSNSSNGKIFQKSKRT